MLSNFIIIAVIIIPSVIMVSWWLIPLSCGYAIWSKKLLVWAVEYMTWSWWLVLVSCGYAIWSKELLVTSCGIYDMKLVVSFGELLIYGMELCWDCDTSLTLVLASFYFCNMSWEAAYETILCPLYTQSFDSNRKYDSYLMYDTNSGGEVEGYWGLILRVAAYFLWLVTIELLW